MVWKTLKENNLYECNDLGEVRRIGKKKPLKGTKNKKGYLRVRFWHKELKRTKSYFVHRLVAIAFIPNPENKPHVNHKDGDKTNNAVTNLEWSDSSEQMYHAVKNNLLEPRHFIKFNKKKLKL